MWIVLPVTVLVLAIVAAAGVIGHLRRLDRMLSELDLDRFMADDEAVEALLRDIDAGVPLPRWRRTRRNHKL